MLRTGVIIVMLLSGIITAQLKFPAVISDNMVLQQNSKVKLWGSAKKGADVKIKSEWGSWSAKASATSGEWIAEITTPKFGGPYTISVKAGDEEKVLKNVMIGEVWLCSGQSNMEMPLEGWQPNDTINNYKKEIAEANYPEVRMFTVAKAVSPKGLEDVKGDWQVCTPENAPKFSATAYFFGRELHKQTGIPVGLIHSSWGGTPVESWTPVETLKKEGEFLSVVNNIDKLIEQLSEIEGFLAKRKTVEYTKKMFAGDFRGTSFNDEQCSKSDFDDSSWEGMTLPGPWEQSELGPYDGVVWFRTVVSLTSEQASQKSVLSLGSIDDMDVTYVNGKRVGGYEQGGFWNVDRVYKLEKGILKSGKNVIAVKVIDNGGGGGFIGQPEKMFLEADDASFKFDLQGLWKYMPTAELRNGVFYLFDVNKNEFSERPNSASNISSQTPSMLYNAMIYPILNYRIKGAIWYQGEANVGRSVQYRKVFPAMIKSWRNKFNVKDMPFYFVQIAPWQYGEGHSEWLRDAQLSTLSLANTGMVVTHDIGINDNIHPSNKQDVGKRLALWALARDYGKNVVYTGPLADKAHYVGGKVEVTFKFDPGEMVINKSKPNQFEICGEDGKFLPAEAMVKGKKLILRNAEIQYPVSVKYAWGNTTPSTLSNKAGLPASSFLLQVK